METADKNTLQAIHLFNAPVEQMWKAWTEPIHITHWWGPKGFSSTIHQMDVRENGEWLLTLHAPDGANFPNKSVYKQIVPLKKIVFEHFYPHFMTTVIFESQKDSTKVNWTLAFDSPDSYDAIVKAHRADVGQRENIEKLEAYLLKM